MKKMNKFHGVLSLCLAGLMLASLTSCGGDKRPTNLINQDNKEKREVNLFSPMEKVGPSVENVARSACDLTIMMAEETLGVSVAYRTYTAENYQGQSNVPAFSGQRRCGVLHVFPPQLPGPL